MRRDRLISPGKRKGRTSARPSRSESANPIRDYQLLPTDPVGRSCVMSASVPPDIRRAASVIVAHGLFGMQDEKDVVRWCLHYGVNELTKRSKNRELIGAMVALNSWVAVCSLELEYLHYERKYKVIELALHKLIAAGNIDRAAQIAEKIWRDTDKFDDPTWQPRFRRMTKAILDRVRELRKEGIERGGGKDRRRKPRAEED